jgi:hypothetical protein
VLICLPSMDRYLLLRGIRAARPIAVGFTGGPSKLMKYESPHASNDVTTALLGAARQTIRILQAHEGDSNSRY